MRQLLGLALVLLASSGTAGPATELHDLLGRLGLAGREQALQDEGWDAEGLQLATVQDLIDSGLAAAEAQKLHRALAGEAEEPPPAALEVGLAAALARAGLGHRAQILLEAGWESAESLEIAELDDLIASGLDRGEAERLQREIRAAAAPAAGGGADSEMPEGREMPTTWVNPNPGAASGIVRSKAVARLLENAACEQYADLVFDAGWDDLQTLKLASWLDLVYTGVKPGHAKRLHSEMHPIPLDEFGREQTCNSGRASSQPSPPEPLQRKPATGPKKVLVATDASLPGILAEHDLVLLDLYAPWW